MNKNNMKHWMTIIIFALIVSTMCHLFFMVQKTDGILMTGFNDGLSQMLPFKKYIYDEYTNGNFFYSDSFGFGGGFYSQLGYYFTTNIFFIIHIIVIFLLESLHIIPYPDMAFWADAILPMSVIKLAAIIVVATIYFKKLSFQPVAAFLGSIIYAANVLYFRHAMYWDFFTDAMFWFVLLLIGIEKIIKKESKVTFGVAVAANLITNFYFAYVNFLLAFFYILVRFMIKFFKNEERPVKQIIQYCYLGIIGFLISAFAFIPSVIGYLENYRPEYTDVIPLLDFTDNILFNSRVLFLPVFVVIIVCFIRFYKQPIFRFFAIISIVGTLLHFVPYVGSVFNGLSAPQNRWEHIVCLAFGGLTAFIFQHMKEVRVKDVLIGAIAYVFLVVGFIKYDDYSLDQTLDWIIPLISVCFVIVFLLLRKKAVFYLSIVLLMVISVNTFQAVRLMTPPKDGELATESVLLHSDIYNSEEQRQLIKEIEKHKNTDHSRIDWMAPTRNNTPIVQDYDGMSVYSSILNDNILFFYYDYAEISMDRESVSRYATLGDRTNLMSLFNGQFYMREKKTETFPYGFTKLFGNELYDVYENQWLLPGFRKTNVLYDADALLDEPVLAREHAMLTGVIVEKANGNLDELQEVIEIHDYSIKEVKATYDGDKLMVHEDGGGLEISLDDSLKAGDLYLSFYIDGIRKKDEFLLEVNEYHTIRKESDSIYRTNVNDLTIRIEADNAIKWKLPKGNYNLRDLQIYYEDYAVLRRAHETYQQEKPLQIKWENGLVTGNVISEKEDEIIATPIPYEKGWTLKVNDEKVPIEKVNYSFIGIPLEVGENEIEMTYLPPYFGWTVGMTACGLLMLFYLLYRRRMNGDK
jgi:uncharacterized membrane protein YfhO